MRAIFILAKLSILENTRRHVFHVLCLIILAVVAGSTLLSIFTQGVQIKIMKDLCMTSILFGGGMLAIALGCSGVPQDLETKNLYPILARPLTRAQYLLGKYVGGLLTIIVAILVMSVVFGILILSYEHTFDPNLVLAVAFTVLQSAIILAIALAFSTVASSPIAGILTFMAYVFGTLKIGYLGHVVDSASNVLVKTGFSIIYHILPNLECFNMKDSLVHHDPVPATYMAQVAIYGVLYCAVVLLAGTAMFSKKEV